MISSLFDHTASRRGSYHTGQLYARACSRVAALNSALILAIASLIMSTALAQSMGPPLPREGVHLSLGRFEALFDASQQRTNRARWRDGLIEIDLSASQTQGIAWVSFQGRADLSEVPRTARSALLDLTSLSVHPLSIWLDQVPHSPTSDGSFHQIRIPNPLDQGGQRPSPLIKLRYPVRLSQNASGEQSGLIPLPPIANADVRVVGQERAKFIPSLSPNQAQITKGISFRGAIAVLIPAVESGLLLQRKDFQVSLQPSGEGADIHLDLTALLRGGGFTVMGTCLTGE